MKKCDIKLMFRFIIKVIMGLLRACTIGSFGEPFAFIFKGPIKCLSVKNQSM